MSDITRIHTQQQLLDLARDLRVRPDWHEPDEQGLDAVVFGGNFDNAGFWGLEHLSRRELELRSRLSDESDKIGSAVIDMEEAHLFTEMFECFISTTERLRKSIWQHCLPLLADWTVNLTPPRQERLS